MQSFDTLIKHRVRAEYRDFLRKTVLRHKKPDELKVLCLPGWEAIEVYDVYDKLGVADRLELALYCLNHHVVDNTKVPPLPTSAPAAHAAAAGASASGSSQPASAPPQATDPTTKLQ